MDKERVKLDRAITALNAVTNPKMTVLANIMFEAVRRRGGP